jgi:hypothetical protein
MQVMLFLFSANFNLEQHLSPRKQTFYGNTPDEFPSKVTFTSVIGIIQVQHQRIQHPKNQKKAGLKQHAESSEEHKHSRYTHYRWQYC